MERTYRTDVDYEYVKDLSFDELIAYIRKNFYDPAYPSKLGLERLAQVMALISKHLGLTLSNEQYIFMLSNVRRLLCEATAGAGKTTVAQLAIFCEKIANNVPGKEILALAYNRSAKINMDEKHTTFARLINGLGVKNLHVTTDLSAKTIHSFCMEWINEYYLKLGLEKDNFVLTDDLYSKIMRAAIDTALKVYNSKEPKKITFFESDTMNFCKLYDYINETLLWDNVEDWALSSAYKDLNKYPVEVMLQVFKFFKIGIRAQGKYPYSEWMDLMYQLLCKKEILARVRRNYKIILVDEYQDVTPAMLRIITMITEGDPEQGLEGYPECRLICIGDNDQSIYRFRGTDPYNCMRFVDTYGKGKSTRVASMSINRRCKAAILDKAKQVIEANQERIVKPIIPYKDGGVVKVSEYISLEQEAQMILSELKRISRNEWQDTCICYRNNSSSMYIAMQLLDAGIPFRIISGDQPFTDKLSQSILLVLDLLAHPADKLRMKKALFRVLPRHSSFNRKVLDDIINKSPEDCKFWELELPQLQGFQESMTTLIFCFKKIRLQSVKIPKPGVTKIVEDDPDCFTTVRASSLMSTYVGHLISLIEKYYFNYQNWDNDSSSSILPEEYVRYIKKYFTRPVTYEDLLKEREKLMKQLAGDAGGLYMSSFHSLKGLEFKNVIVADLDDGIFPGTDFKGNKNLTAEQKTVIEAETRRLFYVVCTRAINSLHLMFSADRPTRFIRFFKETPEIVKLFNASSEVDDGFVAPADIASVAYVEVSEAPEDAAEEFDFTIEDLTGGVSEGLLDKQTVTVNPEIEAKLAEYAEPSNSGETSDDSEEWFASLESLGLTLPEDNWEAEQALKNSGLELVDVEAPEETVQQASQEQGRIQQEVAEQETVQQELVVVSASEVPASEAPEVPTEVRAGEVPGVSEEDVSADMDFGFGLEDLTLDELSTGVSSAEELELASELEVASDFELATDLLTAPELVTEQEFESLDPVEQAKVQGAVLEKAIGEERVESLDSKPNVRRLLEKISWSAIHQTRKELDKS